MGLEELIRGVKAGSAIALDPISFFLTNSVDNGLNGVSIADKERAIPTFVAKVYQHTYPNVDERPTRAAYATRAGGTVLGVAGTGAGLYALAALTAPAVALAAPVALGIYGIVRGLARTVKTYIRGEEIGGRREKASFLDGLRYGYHLATYTIPLPGIGGGISPMNMLHGFESALTGRGYEHSHIDSKMTQAATVRRNFTSNAGAFIGAVAGSLVSILSLGIVPLYKTLRDGVRTARHEMRPHYKAVYA